MHSVGNRERPRRRQRSLLEEQDGFVIILFALAMAVITGFAAISLDAGYMYATRARLSNIADAAALAGANFLPENPSSAYAAALNCAVQNGIAAENVQVGITENNTRVEVRLQGPAELRFAQVGGAKTVNLSANSLGAIEVVTGVTGAQPFGVEKASFVYGQRYAIKLGSHDDNDDHDYHGNYHALSLGSRGASAYRASIESGYPGLLTVGQNVDTEPGNMAGPTEQGLRARLAAAPYETWDTFTPRSSRVLLVPVVDSFDVYGRKSVRIIGFAAFFLEDYSSAENGQVIGRFIRYHLEGRLSAYRPDLDFGLRSARLIR